MPVIETAGLCLTYPDGTVALTDVAFSAMPGEVVAVIGKSGAGKSTLLRCVNGLLRPTAGSVKFRGREVALGRAGQLPTWRGFFYRFTDGERQSALRALNRVEILDQWQKRPAELSGGQQQRVAIARALCQGPAVLLADEPVSSLDPATARTVLDYAVKICREDGIARVANLHSVALAREYADRVVAFRGGRVVFAGTPRELTDARLKEVYGDNFADF